MYKSLKLVDQKFYYNICEYKYYRILDRVNFEFLLLNVINLEPLVARGYVRKRRRRIRNNNIIIKEKRKKKIDLIDQNRYQVSKLNELTTVLGYADRFKYLTFLRS
jgi:hypothetical protein